MSNIFNNSGIAVISLLLSSHFACPIDMPTYVRNADTIYGVFPVKVKRKVYHDYNRKRAGNFMPRKALDMRTVRVVGVAKNNTCRRRLMSRAPWNKITGPFHDYNFFFFWPLF